ncbi:MAG: 6-O-methylguanine DNA methyltransferase [candidate division Zixibacteria bacterium HGW-Zixibacteria-1]|nr:MAG: 6-O-methylguanine DNA methyltransferase [candidate division Zixibacteria bacterium HGW-Zixibacteria-1]
MKKQNYSQQAEDYRRIENAIKYIEVNFKSQPTLDEIAAAVCLSKYHFERLFKRWAGISPMQFMQFLTLDYAKQKLAEAGNLLDTSFDAGLSGPGRLHDLFVTFEAMTPGEFKKLGAGIEIEYGFHPTPFGECLLAATDRGICFLGFVDSGGQSKAMRLFKKKWPNAELIENRKQTESYITRIFAPEHASKPEPFHVLIKGTNFQVNVWRALLTIPRGNVVSYQDVAAYLGRPSAYRAVANAVAGNPVAYLIPCHRVIAKSGKIHHYLWGTARKKALFVHEAAMTASDSL